MYNGRWAGRDVAVKVIEHLNDTSAVVENEVQLQMSFVHENIVRALHYVSYTRPRSTSRISIMSRNSSTQRSRGRLGTDQMQAQLSTASSLSDALAAGTASTVDGGGGGTPPAAAAAVQPAAVHAGTPNSGCTSTPCGQEAGSLPLRDQGRQESSELDCALTGTECSGSLTATAKSFQDAVSPVCRAESWIVQVFGRRLACDCTACRSVHARATRVTLR